MIYKSEISYSLHGRTLCVRHKVKSKKSKGNCPGQPKSAIYVLVLGRAAVPGSPAEELRIDAEPRTTAQHTAPNF